MIKGIIFDLDGTLGYTMPPMQRAMNEMLRSFGYPEHTTEALLQWANAAPREWVGGTLPPGLSDAQKEACFQKYNACYQKYYLETEYYDGVAELVQRLRADGYPLAILSNKQHNHVVGIAKKLSGLHVSAADKSDETNFGPVGDYERAWGVSGRFPSKPAPDAALAIADELGLHAEEMAFIGDSEVDIQTARNAGMVQISVTWGYRPRAFHEALGVQNLADTPSALYTMVTNFA